MNSTMQNLESRKTTAGITTESFANAYQSGYRLTVRFLISKGLNVDQAEETAQSAWVRGWEARNQLRVEGRMLPWINSIAYRRFCNVHRRTSTYVSLTGISDTKGICVTVGAEAALLLNRCSALDQSLLTRRYLQEMELKDIAGFLGLSEVAVRVRLHRCRKALQARIQ